MFLFSMRDDAILNNVIIRHFKVNVFMSTNCIKIKIYYIKSHETII